MSIKCLFRLATALGLFLVSLVFFPLVAGAAKPLVVVSIVPQQTFVQRLAGDLVEVAVMVPPGASPATYEPRPRQMADLSRAEVYFAIGVPFEAAWLPRFTAANPRMRIVHTDAGVPKRQMGGHAEHGGHGHVCQGHDHGHGHSEGHGHAEEHHEGHGHAEDRHEGHGHDHDGDDPHIWLAPELVKIQAATIAQTLAELDPSNAKIYAANLTSVQAELDALNVELAATLAPAKGREFMVFHPAWGYFADAYGLIEVAIEHEGKEPGPAELQKLIDRARGKGIQAIFVQPQFSRRAAETIAREIGAQVVVADPLAADWAVNLRQVAESFAAAAR